MITVRPDSVPCEVPDDPKPIALAAKPLAVGLWRITSTAGVPADKQEFVSDGHALITTQALRDLGGYLADVRSVIAAQRACIAANKAATGP